MTGEVMERAIEFLLKNQAAYEERRRHMKSVKRHMKSVRLTYPRVRIARTRRSRRRVASYRYTRRRKAGSSRS